MGNYNGTDGAKALAVTKISAKFGLLTKRAQPKTIICEAQAMKFYLKKFKLIGQAKKSIRWMPWHQEPMKDVITCEKPR